MGKSGFGGGGGGWPQHKSKPTPKPKEEKPISEEVALWLQRKEERKRKRGGRKRKRGGRKHKRGGGELTDSLYPGTDEQLVGNITVPAFGSDVIIQCGKSRTGSTLLTNILYGLICPTEHIRFSESGEVLHKITKTHNTVIQTMNEKHSKKWNVYFVVSLRGDQKWFYEANNVLYVQYELFAVSKTAEQSVEVVYKKLAKFLPESIDLNLDSAVKRIKKMNRLYEKDYKQSKWDHYKYDPFFGIHQGHRQRSK